MRHAASSMSSAGSSGTPQPLHSARFAALTATGEFFAIVVATSMAVALASPAGTRRATSRGA